jgi:hypothetical protein
VALKLATTALGISLDTPEVALSEKSLREYVGTYATEPAKSRIIALVGKRLYAKIEGDKDLELTPIDRDLFEARADHSRFQFSRRNGRIAALRMEPRFLIGDRTPAKRIAD